jgi:transglutaminase-like putative cysteine protease
MRILTVRHATNYRYARPVTFGQHRLMLRPRDSHDLRLVGAELTLSPPGSVRWMHDVFGNSVALVDFQSPAATLGITSTLKIERYGLNGLQFPISPDAEFYPLSTQAATASVSAASWNSTIPTPTACWRAGQTAS